jgi:hypothetical protein
MHRAGGEVARRVAPGHSVNAQVMVIDYRWVTYRRSTVV